MTAILKRLAAGMRILIEAGLGYALFTFGGLAIGVGVQMSIWPIVVIGILMVLAGFWIIGL